MYRDSRRLRLVLALLIAVSFTMITVDYRAGEGTSLGWLRTAAATVFGPVERAVTSFVRPIGNALSTLGDLGTLHDEADRLRKENAELRERLRDASLVTRPTEDMRRMLELAGRGRFRVVPARVVALGPGNFEWTATIDAGRRDGVRKDQTVINGDGLVGRVLDAGPYTSQVLLAIDPTFSVAARMARSGEMGAVTGRGLDAMRLELFSAQAKIGKNEEIVTMAVPGGFVAGVPIGVATKTERARISLTATVQVQPYVNYTALDAVGVIVEAPRQQSLTALLPTAPPSPTPSPTPVRCPPASPSPSPSPSPSRSPGSSPAPAASPSCTPAAPASPGASPAAGRSPSPSRSP